MACESCRSQARLLLRAATRASRAPTASISLSQRFASRYGAQSRRDSQARSFSSTSAKNFLQGVTQPYHVVGATERLFKGCGNVANYKITAQARKEDRVQKLEDGEEVGEATGTRDVWHKRTFLAQQVHDTRRYTNTTQYSSSRPHSAPGPM